MALNTKLLFGLRTWRALLRLVVLTVFAAIIGLVSTCSPRPTTLDSIRNAGVLKVATVNSPTTYYIGPTGNPAGFDYDLAAGLADQLGVKLELVLAQTPPEAVQLMLDGKAHLAAAGIGMKTAKSAQIRFGPKLQTAVPVLVYRGGTRKPKSLADLDGRLAVVAGSAFAQRLKALHDSDYPDLKWEEDSDAEYEELLFQVAEGKLDYTVASSELVAINQRYYPRLAVAFELGDPEPLAWAFPASGDGSLAEVVKDYFKALGKDELNRVRDRYFGHIEKVDRYGARMLAKHFTSRLPKFRADFEEAARRTGLDWRLLAAVGYQESHWDPNATSPTGVRGVMMLTNATASLLGIENRADPRQSVLGGSAYLRMMLDGLPSEIVEPDRSWMALAAYNIGLGHLFDARDLTREDGGDPDRWPDVRAHLPWLARNKHYKNTRYGYARGFEAVAYVGNVRTYYDMLVWLTEPHGDSDQMPDENDTPDDEAAKKAPDERKDRNPLDIDSPIL